MELNLPNQKILSTRQKGYRMSSTVAFLTVYYILGEL
jgi:hypothetical protein